MVQSDWGGEYRRLSKVLQDGGVPTVASFLPGGDLLIVIGSLAAMRVDHGHKGPSSIILEPGNNIDTCPNLSSSLIINPCDFTMDSVEPTLPCLDSSTHVVDSGEDDVVAQPATRIEECASMPQDDVTFDLLDPSGARSTEGVKGVSNSHHIVTWSKHGIFKPMVYHAIEMTCDDHKPATIRHVLASPNGSNGTWKLVPLPKDRTKIGCKWLFQVKKNLDGSVARYRACLVSKWYYQVLGKDFHDIFSHVVKAATINVVLSLWNIISLEQDMFWEDDELSSLFSKEGQNQLFDSVQADGNLAKARRAAVEWVLKVNAQYSFSALTAVFAVNYLDRFLFSFRFRSEKPWTTQLAAVACLSLAAKVEETQVPLLLDLQVEESRYVFEAKTIQRMEILVLSSLQWKMNPVTPLSFLDFIARRLGLKDHLCWEFLRRCNRILLSVISDFRFMCYLPSEMATAAMLHVVDSVEPSLRVEYENQLLGILGIDKDRVNECCELIMESATMKVEGNRSKKRGFSSFTGSPNGVVDVMFSSDSSNDSWAVGSSSPEPMSKKSRNQQDQLLEMLSIPR
ncbi:cyclin-D3-2-like [Hibiscus syriacus]|nr:cyclin-D3-2-like [Hibiscus syriacus]